MGYSNDMSTQMPQGASGSHCQMVIKNTFVELMPEKIEITSRARTSPDDFQKEQRFNSMNDGYDQQQIHHQQQEEQQRCDSFNQQAVDPYMNTPSCNFGGMTMQMVPIPYVPSQDGYPMQFADPSAFTQPSTGGAMVYSQHHGAWLMPMVPNAFVQMDTSQMPSMDYDQGDVQESVDNQQYYEGDMRGNGMRQPYQGRMNSYTKDKRPPGKKQKEKDTEGALATEGPKAVFVDLSKLRPFQKKSSGTGGRSGWHRY